MALNKTSSPGGYSAVPALGKLTLGEHITIIALALLLLT